MFIAEPMGLGAKRKERDDETDLNYFGARYLDPMLGLWISVDPKRQFASPYLYVGNGVNPLNAIDPDGNAAIVEKADNVVNVTVPVIYEGDAASRDNIATFEKSIYDVFNNQFGEYDVNVSIVEYNPDIHGNGYNNIHLSSKNISADFCPGSPGGCAGTGKLPGYAYINFNDKHARVHEFAHLLGLDDKYRQVDLQGYYFMPYTGYGNNLMGSYGSLNLLSGQIREMWSPGPYRQTQRNGYRANTIYGF